MESIDFLVRQYEAKDREAVRRICCDTAIMGNPIDPVFSDRELFADMITGYYLDHEPEHTWIAEVDSEVVGYLTSSMKSRGILSHSFSSVSPAIIALKRLSLGEYKNDPQNKEFLKWLFLRAPFEMVNHPRNAAHKHYNVKKQYRGKGIGPALEDKFMQTALEKEVTKYYTETFCMEGSEKEEFLKSKGRIVYDRKRITLFKQLTPSDVYLICFVGEISHKPL